MKNRLSVITSFVLISGIVVAGFIFHFTNKSTLKNDVIKTATVVLKSKSIGVRVADTDDSRTQGLSGTIELLPDTGMLFIFDHPAKYSFWMKEMNYPIDIVWIDSDKKIVHIEQNVSPNTFPKSFSPTSPALYVLEVPAGFAQTNHIFIGDSISIN